MIAGTKMVRTDYPWNGDIEAANTVESRRLVAGMAEGGPKKASMAATRCAVVMTLEVATDAAG